MQKENKILSFAKNILLPLVLAVISFVVIFASFYNNFSKNVPDGFENWQYDSEMLVLVKMLNAKDDGILSHAALLPLPYYDIRGDLSKESFYNIYKYDLPIKPNYTVYLKQVGLQGIGASVIDKYLPFNNSQTLKLLYAINCGLLCLMVGFIAFWVYKKVNLVAGLVMFLSCYFNVWLCYGARNLYWVFWTYLLPMCGVVAVVWLEEKTGKTHNIILAVVTFLTVLLKCACGFEFMSCILVAAELPLLYMAITNKWKISTYIKRSCIVGASGLAGFAGAFGINFLQQVVFLNSFSSAVTSMKYGIAKRTGLFASQFKTFSDMLVPQAIEDSLNVPLKNVMTGYFNSTQLFSYKGEFLPINIKQVFFALVGVFALAMVLSLFLKCFKQNRRKLIGLFTITAVSFSLLKNPEGGTGVISVNVSEIVFRYCCSAFTSSPFEPTF
ncbi:MAG: hypothetical protein RR052_01500, partial [Oscillospiraceae bacterium]